MSSGSARLGWTLLLVNPGLDIEGQFAARAQEASVMRGWTESGERGQVQRFAKCTAAAE